MLMFGMKLFDIVIQPIEFSAKFKLTVGWGKLK